MPAHLIGEGLILNLENGKEWIIGRDPEFSDFVIEDPAVSRKHALLSKDLEGFYLSNLSDSKSIYVNGIEYESGNPERILLKEGDQIQFGSHSFRFSEEEIPLQKEKKKDVYEDVFGDLEEPAEPPPPPRNESRNESRDESREETGEEKLERIEEPQEDAEEPSYNTIFDDVESDSELPFNLLQPATLMLKVISGPNAGAEIGLERGRSYVIGRDPNSCGVLFHDYSVSHNHAKLNITADGVMEIEDLGSKNGVLVNGLPIKGNAVITTKDLIALGTTVFMIIDRETAQETLYFPVGPSVEAPEHVESELHESVAAVESDWKNRPLPIKHLIAAGSFLTIFFIVFISFFSLFKSDQIVDTRKEPTTRIKEALAKYSGVEFSYNPATGKLFIVGHVLTSVDYQEMLYRIGEVNFVQSTDNNVVIDELVWKSMNDILSQNPDWRGVSIRSSEPGKFEVVGTVNTAVQSAALSDFLTVNFPYLDKLQNNVVAEDVLTTQIQSVLVKYGFGSVAFQLAGNELVLSGNYSNENKNSDKMLKDLNLLPGISRVKNYTTPTNPNAAGINISQNYQVTGNSTTNGHGYSVIVNGKIYEVGGSVDGMMITAIEPKTILLEKDGIKYKIDYRQ